MIKVQINKICAKLVECEPLIAGMIGKTLEVEFSADWAGLNKTAVFSNGNKTINVLESEWNGNTINIPWEVLETPNRAVSFGIYGYTKNGDDIILAIPTLCTSLGRVYLGVDPDGDESTEPSLPVYAQLDLRVTELEEHGGGGGTSDHSQLSNRDANNQHPMSAITGLEGEFGQISDAFSDVFEVLGGKLSDAPSDGKTYGRKNGAWAEVQSSGGGDNTLVVTVWLSDYGTPAIIGTPSTTHAEIIDAIENGKDITLVAQIDDSSTRYNFDIVRSDGDYWPVVFGGLILPNDDYWGAHTAVYISVSPANVWSISYDDYALKSDLPGFTTDPEENVYKINGQFIAARYDDELNDIADTYAKKAMVIKETNVTSTTFAEITAAYNDGRIVLFEDDHSIMMLTNLTSTLAQFQGITASDGGNNRMYMSYANVTSAGNVTTSAFWMPTTLYVDNKINTAISNAIGGAY